MFEKNVVTTSCAYENVAVPLVFVNQTMKESCNKKSLVLTSRGKIVVFAFICVTLLFFLFAVVNFVVEKKGVEPSLVQHTVSVGESLWSVALEFAPNLNTWDIVTTIVELNNLPNTQIENGQTIFVPMYN